MPPVRSAFGDDADVLRETDFQLLLLATMFPILGTAIVSPVLDSVIEPFGTSPAGIGLMISFFTAPAIFIIPIAGLLADRYGRRPVLVAALLLFGIGGASIVLTTDFRVVLALRFVQGFGFGGLVPTITASIGDMFDEGKEVTGQGLRMTVNGLSSTVFPLFAGALVAVGWRYPFLLYAAAIPVAVVVYLRFDEPTDTSEDDQHSIEGGAYLKALGDLVRRPLILSFVVGRSLPVAVWIGLFTYNSLVVVRVMDGTPFQAGVLVAVGSLVFATAASQVGRIQSRFGGKFYPLVLANVALALGFVGFLFSPGVYVAALWVALAGAGFGISISLYRSYLTELAPKSLRAGVVSLGAAGARVTATAIPIVMGLVINRTTPMVGEEVAIQLAGICAALVGGVGGLLCLLVAARSDPVTDKSMQRVRD